MDPKTVGMLDPTNPGTVQNKSDLERAVNRAYASVFQQGEGPAVLRHLVSHTLERYVYGKTRDARGPRDDALYGAWRDGQNQLVREILGRINRGREGQ